MKMSQIAEEACREAAIYQDAGVVSLCVSPHVWSPFRFCHEPDRSLSTFVSGWCHYWEHAWYSLLILCGPWGGFMHDCSVHSCEKHLSVNAAWSANSLCCKSAGVGCGSRFRSSLCIITVVLYMCEWWNLREAFRPMLAKALRGFQHYKCFF